MNRPTTPTGRLPLLLPLALLASAAVAAPAPAAAQSAADVMADFRAAYLENMEGIENYTVVQRTGDGGEAVTYFERTEVDGMPVFQPRMEIGDVDMSEQGSFDQAYFLRPEVAERMTYGGTDEVRGNRCRIVELTDFTGLQPYESEMEISSMTFCFDAESHMPRRMTMDGVVRADGQEREMGIVSIFEDYREVQGMMHPYRVEMTMSGLGQSPEMQQMMQQMEEQLAQLPEGQRARMRQMMESRMGGAMNVLTGEPIVMETVEVRVNAGPPQG